MCDIIFHNANVISMDPATPSAQLIAVKGDRIAAVTGNEMLGGLKVKRTRIVDCGENTIIPGFVDAHCHIAAYAESLISLNLSPKENVRTISDIQDKIRDFCMQARPGAWVRGKGYNEFYIAENRHPNRWELDAAAPANPVKLTHRSGHAHLLNSLALESVGIGAETGDPPGGMIERDLNTGLPTGLLYGMSGFLSDKIPGLIDSEMERGLKLANARLLSYGITSVQDASSSNDLKQWKRFESWKEKGILDPRLTMMLGSNAFSGFDKTSYASHIPEAELRMGSIKIIADRVTGSLRPSQGELNEIIASIHTAGFQAAIHAIEEPAAEAAVNAIEYAMQRHPRPDPRHRIEHCSVCSPILLEKLAKLGGMVVTQPAFLFYEGERYLKTVPAEQLECLYPVDAMLENGLKVGAGSDAPIADPNPLVSIGAAVARRSENGSRLPGQGVDLHQSIKMHTLDAAGAGFEEKIKGSLSPGKIADFVLLSDNPFSMPADRIRDIRVIMTVLGGRIAWSEAGNYGM
jgi:predicted amidohydrolase YtcJ